MRFLKILINNQSIHAWLRQMKMGSQRRVWRTNLHHLESTSRWQFAPTLRFFVHRYFSTVPRVIQIAQNGVRFLLAKYYSNGQPHGAIDTNRRKTMTEEITTTAPTPESTDKPKTRRKTNEKSLRTLSLTEVDGALAVYDKTIRMNTELVKTKLTSGGAIPSDVLRDLSVANKQKARLTMRRIALLIETGDTAVMDLIDKLCKIKPVKATA